MVKGMATHTSILAWRVSWPEDRGKSWGCKDLDVTNNTVICGQITQLKLSCSHIWECSFTCQIWSCTQSQSHILTYIDTVTFSLMNILDLNIVTPTCSNIHSHKQTCLNLNLNIVTPTCSNTHSLTHTNMLTNSVTHRYPSVICT